MIDGSMERVARVGYLAGSDTRNIVRTNDKKQVAQLIEQVPLGHGSDAVQASDSTGRGDPCQEGGDGGDAEIRLRRLTWTGVWS